MAVRRPPDARTPSSIARRRWPIVRRQPEHRITRPSIGALAWIPADAVLVELEHEIGRAREVGQPLVLAFVDIDHLGAINESHGRGADARLLARVASTLRAELRSCDLVFRHGNAEFVCALPGLDTADAAKQFGLVNGALADAEHGSVAVGFAELRPDESADDLVARAKDALVQEHRQQPEA